MNINTSVTATVLYTLAIFGAGFGVSQFYSMKEVSSLEKIIEVAHAEKNNLYAEDSKPISESYFFRSKFLTYDEVLVDSLTGLEVRYLDRAHKDALLEVTYPNGNVEQIDVVIGSVLKFAYHNYIYTLTLSEMTSDYSKCRFEIARL